MKLEVQIKKELDGFILEQNFVSTKKRLGILGASGSGKSLTLKSIAGIETPDSGVIKFQEKVLYASNKKINIPVRNRKVGYLFQNYALFPNMTVEKNITISINGKKEQKEHILEKYLKQFSLEQLRYHYPSELSGGQQQRVALARIMAYEPEVILLDEPFSAMDDVLKQQLKMEMEEYLKDYQGKLIIVSHSKDEIYQFSEELLVLENGKCIEFGDTKELFQAPKKLETARLMGCENISRVQIQDNNHIFAIDWGIPIQWKEENREIPSYIGIYGEYLRLSASPDSKESFINAIAYQIQWKEKAFSYEVSVNLKENKTFLKFQCSKDEKELLEKECYVVIPKGHLIYID